MVLLKKETANLVIGIAMLVIPFATLMLKIIEVARS
jgi:orotate phosphoribosyltransferase-like protein